MHTRDARSLHLFAYGYSKGALDARDLPKLAGYEPDGDSKVLRLEIDTSYLVAKRKARVFYEVVEKAAPIDAGAKEMPVESVK